MSAAGLREQSRRPRRSRNRRLNRPPNRRPDPAPPVSTGGLARSLYDRPWRAVPVLGVTQVLTWGTMFYPPVLIVPLIAADRGWPVLFPLGGLSLALLTARPTASHKGTSI